jgi:glycosyltransferase involved in cell wall biosynthesis
MRHVGKKEFDMELDIEVIEPGTGSLVRAPLETESELGVVPMVSCAMVTRGYLPFVRTAVGAFLAQSYPTKELVIVSDANEHELRSVIEKLESQPIRLITVDKQLSLGELRNIAIANCGGEFICQWDDDDLYDPDRIRVSLLALLKTQADALFLKRWLVWWPERRLLSVSAARIWEGSILARRSVMRIYRNRNLNEDSEVVDWIAASHRLTLLDFPSLYCYRITGRNSFSNDHFDSVVARSTRLFSNDEYDTIVHLLSSRMPTHTSID